MNETKTTKGQRIIKVFITIGFILSILSLTPFIFKYEGDSFLKILYLFTIASLPLLITILMQYIIYGVLNPFHFFKK